MEKVSTRLLTEDELKILQREERSILAEIKRICDKNGIRYYIVGGTLLGAVRHGGFIPWDDDIDIAMYRTDFEKFKLCCEKELGDKFFLQTYFTDKGYTQLMPKVRKNGTRLVFPGIVNLNVHKGVFVDIFMLDYAAKLDWTVKTKHVIHKFFSKFFDRKQHHNIENPIKRAIVNLIPAALIVHLNDFIVSSKKENALTVNYSSIYGYKKQTFPSDYYGEGVDIKFDDITVKAPNEYIKILESIYGDYMKLPPLEKRGIHHKIHSFEVTSSDIN